MSNYELVSQYTEDAFAKEDRLCQRPACGTNIAKGDPCFYVATIEHGKPGRYVCGPCHEHYQKKAATSVRPAVRPTPGSASGGSSGFAGRGPPDPHVIRQSVNAGQRKPGLIFQVSVNPLPVIPLSHGRSKFSAGPDISVPSLWQPSSQQTLHSSTGYTPHHAHYGSERDRWAKLSYAPPPSQMILLKISAVHEGGSRKKGGRGTPFGSICEGKKDIDAQIDAPGLIKITLDTWRDEEFVVRDSQWVDLSGHHAHEPYFYSQCVQAGRKGLKSPIFKTKQFALMVVVPESQWRKYEEWTERVEEWTQQAEEDEATRQAPMATTAISKASVDVFQGEDNLATGVPLPSKRTHVRTASSLSSTSPPLKKAASTNIFRSPDRNELKEALRSGGTANVDAQSVYDLQNENVQLYWITTRPMSQILENNKYQSFTLHTAESVTGQLTVDTSSANLIGQGGFKSAHPGWLTLASHIPTTRLGSIPHQKVVVVKRPFIKIFPPSGPSAGTYKVGCYAVANELSKQFKEANVLYWANSLLDLTYAFVNRCVAASSAPPPFEIPRLCFVHAGLALSFLPGQMIVTKLGAKPCSIRTAFLLEELIPGGPDAFVKFIHNTDCNPLLDPDEDGYSTALFLAFTQHVQYEKTGDWHTSPTIRHRVADRPANIDAPATIFSVMEISKMW
ncbi:uncharacterized protein HD556DRAFT_1314653 [Suillus plorans]|uniref:Alpha-type protein kinase domain-containing protein n=1 Tax=Suillus plorans TaxID=116603 RepID=A0A9P7AA47_9AGAM|nr:uncharacterized protein HD556DRAFT_1314653 [Suillus plorans]KAG1784918.1 hypothetical protein HD556DRAFT_1314653 [Suillus plorans]